MEQLHKTDILELDELPVISSCQNQCARPYCNGIRHTNASQFLYPACHKCGIELNDLKELLENKGIRNRNICEICSIPYTKNENTTHFLTHFYKSSEHFENKFYCIACASEDATGQPDELTIKPEMYYCSECNYSCDSKALIKRHKRTIHSDRRAEKSRKNIQCDLCTQILPTAIHLQKHIKSYHSSSIPEDSELPCRVCPELKFETRGTRTAHELEMHQNKTTFMYDCPYCDRDFDNMALLGIHVTTHLEATFLCTICGKGFVRLFLLQKHETTHITEKNEKCSICDKMFATREKLRRHLLTTHATEKRFKCDKCDKRYSDSSTLTKHKWTHGGYEKKFSCIDCNMKFFDGKALRQHHRRKHEYPDTTKNNSTAEI